MTRVTAVLVVLLVLAATPRASAADALESFVAEVVAKNPSLRARSLERDAVRHEAAGSDLWPDPTATLMLDNVPEREGGDMPMLRYQLEQMIPWPGKLGLMRAAIERQADAASAAIELRRLELVLEARRGFAMLALNRRARELNAASNDLVGLVGRAAVARFGVGSGGHHEVARAEVERAALAVEALDLSGERISIVAMLNSLRNARPSTPIEDPGAMASEAFGPSLTARQAEERALRQRPELALMYAMQREQEAMGALARRERYPDLMGGLWYNHVLGGPDSGGLMVGVTLPVWGVSRQNRRAEAADARASGARQEIAAMQAMIRFEVADALRRVDTASREVELLENLAIPRVRESFQASLAAYATGSGDLSGVLEARRSFQAMELARARAEASRAVAFAELDRAVGGPPNRRAR